MDKTPGKVTCVEAARKGREKYMKNLKESILNDVKKGNGETMQTMKLAALPTPPPQDQMILMSMVLVCCCPCHWCFCIFCI